MCTSGLDDLASPLLGAVFGSGLMQASWQVYSTHEKIRLIEQSLILREKTEEKFSALGFYISPYYVYRTA